jgi:hypothetical protein
MNYLASNDDPKDTFLAMKVTLAAEVPVWARIILQDKRRGVLDIDYRKKVPLSVHATGLQIDRTILTPAIKAIARRVAGVASEAAA